MSARIAIVVAALVAVSSTLAAQWPSYPTPDVPRDPATDRRFMQLWFVEGAPESAWSTVESDAKAFDASGLGQIVFASPWKPTLPGTDTYTDQLW